MNIKKYHLTAAIVVFAAAYSVYFLTAAPTVWFIDSGELATVATTLSIAHPPGYPLFTLLGHVFTFLPIPSSQIYKLNLMSTILGAFATVVCFYLLRFMISSPGISAVTQTRKKTDAQARPAQTKTSIADLPPVLILGVIVLGSLVIAYSQTFWHIALSVESYPIHCFLLPILMLVFLKAIQNTQRLRHKNSDESFLSQNRYYFFFSYLLGLSFCNHFTTILLAPACLTLFFVNNVFDMKRMFKLLGFMALFFIIALSLFTYLPLRASEHPTLIWGNPVSLENFLWHVSTKQFTVWIFSGQGSVTNFIFLLGIILAMTLYGLLKQKSLDKFPMYHFAAAIVGAILTYVVLVYHSTDTVKNQFVTFFNSLGTEYGTGVIILALIGAYRLSKHNLTIYYFTVLTLFGCALYSVNYDIHNIDTYFSLSYITLGVWICFGALLIAEKAAEFIKDNAGRTVLAVLIVLIGIIPLKTNWEVNDESKNHFVEEYTMNMFRNVDTGGIVISSEWDFWLAASWYYKYVEKIRPDIVVIDKELLRRSWYFTYLQRNFPDVYNNSKEEIEKFLAELYKFEHSLPYDTRTISKLYSDMLTSFAVNNPGRKVYTTLEIEQSKEEKFATDDARIPDGLLFRIMRHNSVDTNIANDYKIYDFKFTPTTNTDYYHKTLMFSYATMLTGSAKYLISIHRNEDAKKYLDLALTAIPNFPQAMDLKKKNNL